MGIGPGEGVVLSEFGTRHCNQWGLYRRTCETVPRPSELRFGMVPAVGQGIAVLDGVHVVQGKGEVFWGGLFPIFTMGSAIRSPRVKCFPFVCEILSTFLFGKRIVGKLDSCAFWRYIHFQDQSWGLWEISKKQRLFYKNLGLHSKVAGVTCIFMNERHGALAHRPRPDGCPIT